MAKTNINPIINAPTVAEVLRGAWIIESTASTPSALKSRSINGRSPRAINSDPKKRGEVEELVVWNRPIRASGAARKVAS